MGVCLTLNTCVGKWDLFVNKGDHRSYVKIGCSDEVKQFDSPEAAIGWARGTGRWQHIEVGTLSL